MKKEAFYNNLKLRKNIWQFLQNLEDNIHSQEQLLFNNHHIDDLEKKLKIYYQCEYALTFSSATNALTALVLTLGLQDREIITSPYNYGASLGGLLMKQNQLIFTKVNPDLSMDTADIHHRITKNTAAIWAVDFGGYPHDMETIREICCKYKLLYIADASQSLGALSQDKPASSLADVWVTSFGANKTLYAGEGGAILTNRKMIYHALLHYLHPTRSKIEVGLKAYNEFAPINGRIHPLAAMIANEHFYLALEKNKKESSYRMAVLKDLKRQTLINDHFLSKSSVSTFFHWLAVSNVSINQINKYLSKRVTTRKIWAEACKIDSVDGTTTLTNNLIQLYSLPRT
ncbi:MAG: aminotransferase class V-fold PLP-dependent enzyme [Flammeovirgaceae bacterium]